MSTCDVEHELCKVDESLSPTRLIHVTNDPPKLVLGSELVPRPRYVTLSHSRGGYDIIKLTSDNLDSLKRALPVDDLPLTLKDAIEVTRKLGIDYLWIDSLCIIQDSETDWENESALMSSVYGQSACTIAASSARNSTEGMFRVLPFYSGGFRARITDGGRKRVQDFRTEDVYERSALKTHLGTRAWALQEKMLAARTIHFGERGAFWECRTTMASQYLPDGFPKQLVRPLVRRNEYFKWLYQWPMIVRLYSAANLTFGKDKLPALSGVARLVFEETGDEYLAGLWKAQLEEQLCWRRFQSNPTDQRPPWRAPTWSWASMDGGVAWRPLQNGILETKYAHVLEARTVKRGADPFGQITSGVVRLACSGMVVGHLTQSHYTSKQGSKESETMMMLSSSTEQVFPITLDCLVDGQLSNDWPIHLLPILGGRTGLRHGVSKDVDEYIDEMMIEGVVLRATQENKGEFIRIGGFSYTKGTWPGTSSFRTEDELYEPFLESFKENGKAIAEEICAEIVEDENNPNHRFALTII